MSELKSFQWPAQNERDANPQLDQVCLYAEALEARLEALESTPKAPPEQDPDEHGWADFSQACRAKMARKRDQGRGGWHDPRECPPGSLQQMLIAHLAKGDPIDVANFAMMIWNRGESVRAPKELERVHENAKAMSELIHNMVVGQQSAWIEWQRGHGAEAAMTWIHNALAGPGALPPEDEPYSDEPQAWFDANRADPFPRCSVCERPSNQLWCGHGACCNEHMRQIQCSTDTRHHH